MENYEFIIICKNDGEIVLTPLQLKVFLSEKVEGGLCPLCHAIPKQVRRVKKEEPEEDR